MSRPTDRLRGVRMAIEACQQHTHTLSLFGEDDEHEQLWLGIEDAAAYVLLEELGLINALRDVRLG